MFNFKRLKFIFKRKDKHYKPTLIFSVTDGTIIDTSNYSDTLYNIVCSKKNIPCDTNTRTLDYYQQLDTIIESNEDYNSMTNSIIVIYFKEVSTDYFNFINHLNKLYIKYYLESDKIIISLSITDTYNIFKSDLDNSFINTSRVLCNMTFNKNLYPKDIDIDNDTIDNHHDIKLSSDNKPIMLPLQDNEQYHIYVLENQLLNFLESELSNGFNFTEVSLESLLNTFVLIVCFDNFNSKENELKTYSSYDIKPNSNRLICKYYISDLIYNIDLFDTNNEESFILYNFFLNTYNKCLEVLNNKYNLNIQMMNSLENNDFLEGIDEII